jgi:hypothetical protein
MKDQKRTDRLLPYSSLGYDFPPNCIDVKYHMINADISRAMILLIIVMLIMMTTSDEC